MLYPGVVSELSSFALMVTHSVSLKMWDKIRLLPCRGFIDSVIVGSYRYKPRQQGSKEAENSAVTRGVDVAFIRKLLLVVDLPDRRGK